MISDIGLNDPQTVCVGDLVMCHCTQTVHVGIVDEIANDGDTVRVRAHDGLLFTESVRLLTRCIPGATMSPDVAAAWCSAGEFGRWYGFREFPRDNGDGYIAGALLPPGWSALSLIYDRYVYLGSAPDAFNRTTATPPVGKVMSGEQALAYSDQGWLRGWWAWRAPGGKWWRGNAQHRVQDVTWEYAYLGDKHAIPWPPPLVGPVAPNPIRVGYLARPKPTPDKPYPSAFVAGEVTPVHVRAPTATWARNGVEACPVDAAMTRAEALPWAFNGMLHGVWQYERPGWSDMTYKGGVDVSVVRTSADDGRWRYLGPAPWRYLGQAATPETSPSDPPLRTWITHADGRETFDTGTVTLFVCPAPSPRKLPYHGVVTASVNRVLGYGGTTDAAKRAALDRAWCSGHLDHGPPTVDNLGEVWMTSDGLYGVVIEGPDGRIGVESRYPHQPRVEGAERRMWRPCPLPVAWTTSRRVEGA